MTALHTMTLEELGRYAVTLPPTKWRWMPGMADTGGDRILYVRNNGDVCTSELVDEGGYDPWREHRILTDAKMREPWQFVPDFSDPATLGCVLALVREALADPGLSVRGCRWLRESTVCTIWQVVPSFPPGAGALRVVMLTDYDTEAHALIAALEAAP